MSQIETIGTALFGQSWMSQVASVLTNENGQGLSRQTVQSWHNRDNLPQWAKAELKSIAAKRKNEVNAMYELLNADVTLEPQSGDGWRTTTFSSEKSRAMRDRQSP